MKTVRLAGEIKQCQFCTDRARFDSKTTLGPWAYLCGPHFAELGTMQAAAFRLTYDDDS
jgi:hypothetical protein